MLIYAASALINCISTFILGAIVLSKDYRNRTNVIFSIFAFDISLWSLAYFIWQISTTPENALLWSKILMAFAIFIPLTYLQFIYTFFGTAHKMNKFMLTNYVFFSIFSIADLFTPYFVSHVEPLLGFKYWPVAGVIFGPFLLVWGIYVLYSCSLLYLKQRNATGMVRVQIKYIFLGSVIGFIGGATNFLLWFHIPVPPFGNPFILAYVALTAYAIIRHRFLNITFAIRKILIYLTTTIFTSVIIFEVVLVLKVITIDDINPLNIIAIFIGALAIAVFLPKLQQFSSMIWDTFVFGRTVNYTESLNELSQKITKVLDIEPLSDLIVTTLINTMGLTRASILVIDFKTKKFRIIKSVGFNEENGISMVEENFLTKYLERNQRIIILEELAKLAKEKRDPEAEFNLQELVDSMRHIEAELIIPLLVNNKVISLIVLGNKRGGDAYTIEDIKLLEIIAAHASIAIENARLYGELFDFSKNLELKVRDATEEVQKRNNQLIEANIQIGLADKVKNDLLTMASHEFRTPTSIITNALWFLNKDEVKQKLSDKERQNLDRIVETMDRLNYVVNNINQMLLTTGGNLELNLMPTQIEILIKEVVEDKKIEASEKQINIDYREPQELLPEIVADSVKLKYVIWELLTNALKYTGKGGSVTVETGLTDERMVMKIKDTGSGINSEKLPMLFDGFSKIDIFHTTQPGMGLGLYIVKKIINLHQGTINVESEQGKGTTFSISLPVKVLGDVNVENTKINSNGYAIHDSAANGQMPNPLQLVKCLIAFNVIVGSIISRRPL